MSATYNIFDEKEMNEIISISECMNLRSAMNMLTFAPMITKKEYIRLFIVIESILKRMEESENSE